MSLERILEPMPSRFAQFVGSKLQQRIPIGTSRSVSLVSHADETRQKLRDRQTHLCRITLSGCISWGGSSQIFLPRNRKLPSRFRSLSPSILPPSYFCPMVGCEERPPDPDWQAVTKTHFQRITVFQVMRHYIGKKHGVLDRYVKETLAEVICQFVIFHNSLVDDFVRYLGLVDGSNTSLIISFSRG